MQGYKVVISDLAKTDLQKIISYISKNENVAVAKHVEHGILSEMKKLERFPTAYPKDDYASTNEKVIRFLVKWSYKILFFIEKNKVYVVGIFHTAQNPSKLSLYSL